MQGAVLLSIGRFICTVPWFVICCVPFYPQRRVSRAVMVFVISTVSIFFFLCNFFFQLQNENYICHSSIVFLILYAVMFGLFLWGFRVAPVKILYIFLLVQAVSTAINYTAAILLRPFYPGERISLQSNLAYSLVILLITAVLMPTIWYFFVHQLREAMEELRNRDFWLLCISPILIFIVTVIFNDMGNNTAIPQEQAIGIFLLISATGLVTYFINVRLVLNAARRIRLETSVAAMEQQMEVQVQSYLQLTESIETSRALRHDLRHHLTAMTSFIEQNDMNGLAAYLAEYRQNLPFENELQVCGNHTVDVLVRYYLQQAEEAGAEVDVKLELPADTGIKDTDLTIVFGNLFENAEHSVIGQSSGRRFIFARCGIENNKLILTVDNSVEEKSYDRKGIRQACGIGQNSVKAVAEKYHGTVRFSQEGNVYKASVLLFCELISE